MRKARYNTRFSLHGFCSDPDGETSDLGFGLYCWTVLGEYFTTATGELTPHEIGSIE